MSGFITRGFGFSSAGERINIDINSEVIDIPFLVDIQNDISFQSNKISSILFYSEVIDIPFLVDIQNDISFQSNKIDIDFELKIL